MTKTHINTATEKAELAQKEIEQMQQDLNDAQAAAAKVRFKNKKLLKNTC